MPVFILLIDDGSTDQSSEICEQYAREHDNISVIHKENGGLSSARNTGIRNAESEWIGFVDSDDWITEDMYVYLYQLQKRYQADVVQIEYMIAPEEKEVPTVSGREEVICLNTREEIMRRYLTDGMKPAKSYSACTKLYRRTLFNDICFPEGEAYEDVITNYEILLKTDRYIVSSKQCYYYFIRKQSITKGRFQQKDLDYIKAGEQIAERTARNPALRELGQMTLARFHFMCLCKMLKYGCDEDVDWKNQIQITIPIIRSGMWELMKSGMKTDRKILMILFCSNIRLTTLLAKNQIRKFSK